MRRSFPIYLQYDATDCGAACVRMIAAWYGRQTSAEQVQQMCSVGRDGVSLLGICNALENIGFKTVAGKVALNDLAERALLPCILHWRQEHFIILYKVKKRHGNRIFYIADPAKGLLELNDKDMHENWISTSSKGIDKGSALLAEPSGAFFKTNRSEGRQKMSIRDKLSFLWAYFSKYKAFFLQLVTGLLVSSLILLSFPLLTQAVVDIGIEERDINFIWIILLGQMALLLGRTLIDFLRSRVILHISTRVNLSLISDFFIKLMKLPMSFFDTKLTGDIIQRLEDHRRVDQFLTIRLLDVSFAIIIFTVFGTVLVFYSWRIFLVFLAGTLLYALWMSIFLKRRRKLDYKYFERQVQSNEKTLQIIDTMQETKLHGAEHRRRWEWEDTQADLYEVNLEALRLQQTQSIGSILINETKNVFVTVVSATGVISGSLTLGMMLSIQYIIGQLISPVEKFIGAIYAWQDIDISLDRMNEIRRRQDENTSDRTVRSFSNEDRSIQIQNLSFRYEGIRDTLVLKDVNLFIPHGKITAIVGASGSGKTTLIKLLLGYYLPTAGDILIGNESLSRYDIQWWRDRCGAVMQDGCIYSDSIAGNIAVAEDTPDITRLRYAADMAGVSEFTDSLPLGFNTKIGDDGQGLSQGQKQRILIARAVYKNPDYLFLDEATNSLDAGNEYSITRNLETFYHGRTVVIVAHRLSTVRNADNIVVLDHGRIVEQGAHHNLISLRGKYYTLIKNQLELGT